MKTVAALVPLSWSFVPRDFFLSWHGIMGYNRGVDLISLYTVAGCYMDNNRNDLVAMAEESGADYYMWLDADQTYQPDTIERLMRHVDAGRLVVGGLTPHRTQGYPMAYAIDPEGNMCHAAIAPHTGLQRVDAMGFGGVMTHPSVFSVLADPYFVQDTHTRKGEDYYFYRKCKESGIEVWCDTDLTFGHLRTVPLRFKD